MTTPPFFTTWVILEPGQTARSHKHQEHEAFVITRGRGRMRVDDETREVTAGDVVFIQPWSTHELTNLDDQGELHFIDLCWEKMEEAVEINDEVLSTAAPGAAGSRALITAASPEVLKAAGIHGRYLAQRGVETSVVEASAERAEEIVERWLESGVVTAAQDGFSLSLAPLQDALKEGLAETRMSARLRARCEGALADGGDLTVSRQQFERAAACLATAEDLGEAGWTVFFDAGDALAYGVLLPALCLAAGSDGPKPSALVDLEGIEVPEAVSTDTAEWDAWFDGLRQRVSDGFDGSLPSTGAWTDGQQRFFHTLTRLNREVGEAYAPGAYSPARVRRALDELVDKARDFSADESHWRELPSRFEEWRTTVALEALAAKTLARLAAPLAPEFAGRLWSGLGFDAEPAWEDVLVFVPGGQKI